jgi:hypothetical protein
MDAWGRKGNKGVSPKDVFAFNDGSVIISWKPECGHLFKMQIRNWVKKPICPKCGFIVKALEPKVIAEEVKNSHLKPAEESGGIGCRFFLFSLVASLPGSAIAEPLIVATTPVSWDVFSTTGSMPSGWVTHTGFGLIFTFLIVPSLIFGLLWAKFNSPKQRRRRSAEAKQKLYESTKKVIRRKVTEEYRDTASKRRQNAVLANKNLEGVPARIPLDADDFETVCAEWMKKAGFNEVSRTPKGPDGGIDVIAANAVGQAKFHPSQKVTGESIRALVGSKVEHRKSRALFFHYGPGYTPDAIEAAKSTKVELYQLNVNKRRFKRIV